MATPGEAASGARTPGESDTYVDDTEEPEFEVTAADNVYSYFMFIGPTEHKKEGSAFTTDVIMAYLLLLLSFCFQGVLLYTIFFEVVTDNVEWQNGIVAGGGGALKLAVEAPKENECNDGGSLCFVKDGIYSCAPPSVQLTGRWEELDWNNDGIWTLEEVMEKRAELKCKYVVDPVEVFNVFHKFLMSRQHLIWLHPDVVAGKAIHKPYFKYAMGDIIMCGYRNADMCGNLMERGFFDAPLKHGTAPRVGKTIDSAMEYCQGLLEDGGTCGKFLPSTYSVWRIDSGQQCGDPEYEKFVYTHPASGVTKSLLMVDWSARQDFERAKTHIFLVYKGIIIFLWLLAMSKEFKDIIIVVTWVLRFPSAEDFGEDAVKEEVDPDNPEDIRYIIQGITKHHRQSVAVLIFLRFCMTVVLTGVGLSFLSKQTDYIDLLMDGIALLFILEIAEILYGQVLRADVRDQTESLRPMKVRMYGIDWLNRRPAHVDALWLAAILCLTVGVMYSFHTQVVVPVSDGLECTCMSQGSNCREAERFSAEFWENYWLREVPAVYEEVNKMSGGAVPQSFAAADARMGEDDVVETEPTVASVGAVSAMHRQGRHHQRSHLLNFHRHSSHHQHSAMLETNGGSSVIGKAEALLRSMTSRISPRNGM